MKKISILSIMLTAIVVGVFAVNIKLNAQDPKISASDKDVVEKSSKSNLHFIDYSCYGCMEKKGMVIGRDISFKLNGVKVNNVRLMVINKETREFDALFVEGRFLERKVIIDYPMDYLIDGGMEYSADHVDKTKAKITLKGHAKVFDQNDKKNLSDNESIEADEIIINLIE